MIGNGETALVAVEVRSADEARREAVMVVCRYGETTDRLPRRERFMPGAFTRSVAERGLRVPFTTAHTGGTGTVDKATMIARAASWEAGDAELRARLKFFDTPDGWEAFCDARDGKLDAGSVGFRPVEERTAADGTREITEAMLHHVALLCRAEVLPAYDAPTLLEVRAASDAATVAGLLAVKWDAALAERSAIAELARGAASGTQ
jgi:hypothetical protein